MHHAATVRVLDAHLLLDLMIDTSAVLTCSKICWDAEV